MSEMLSQLWVEIDVGSGNGAEDLARLAGRLRVELLDLEVRGVQFAPSGEAPEDSKGVSLLAAGALLVRFAGHDVLQSIIDGVRSWLARQHCRSVTLTLDGDLLELTGVSAAEQDRLVDLWVARHAGVG